MAINLNADSQARNYVRFGTVAMWLNEGEYGRYFSGTVQFGDFKAEGEDADVIFISGNCPDWMYEKLLRGVQPKDLRITLKFPVVEGSYTKVGRAECQQETTNDGFKFYRGTVQAEQALALSIPSPWVVELWGTSKDGSIVVDTETRRPILKGRAAVAEGFPHGEAVAKWIQEYRSSADSYKKERSSTN